MRDPQWKCVANLGDVNYIDYGGIFVYVDKVGDYDPQVEVLEVEGENEDVFADDEEALLLKHGDMEWIIYRFSLVQCTYVNGILSDNPNYPDHPVWWAKDLDALVSQYEGMTVEELASKFCSFNPVERAWAYVAVGRYWGFHNFDGDPLVYECGEDSEDLNPRQEVKNRYTDIPKAVLDAYRIQD